MPNLTTFFRHHQDEPVLQQLENHLQYLTRDKKAAIAIAAFYDATKPAGIDFDYICIRSNCNSSIALLRKLSLAGKLAVARAMPSAVRSANIAEELAVLEQLQGAIK